MLNFLIQFKSRKPRKTLANRVEPSRAESSPAETLFSEASLIPERVGFGRELLPCSPLFIFN